MLRKLKSVARSPLTLILLISAFFRFYNYLNFQYWSGDEEVFTAVIRHIIWDKSPTLLIPNSNLGFGLGPYFNYLLVPFYFVTNFNLVITQSIGSFLGIATTYFVYLAGREIKDKQLGLIASFIYATSFLISLFDRRLWPLTPDPFFAALTVFLLTKIAKGGTKLIPLLAIPIGFSFHSDPTLLVLTLVVVAAWIYFRFPLLTKQTIYFALILIFFLLPLVVAEVRYGGAVSQPIISNLTKPARGEGITSEYTKFELGAVAKFTSKIIYTQPSKFIEEEFCTCITPASIAQPLAILLLVAAIGTTLFVSIKHKIYKYDKNSLYVVWAVAVNFLLGTLLYNGLFKGKFYEHYFLVIIPVLVLFLAILVRQLYQKSKPVALFFLTMFFIANLHTLLKSEVKYPLHEKINLVNWSAVHLQAKNFELLASSSPYVHGGGWNELYILSGHSPTKSYWYEYWDWIYSAHSLYPNKVQYNGPSEIVAIEKRGDNIEVDEDLKSIDSYKDLTISVYTTVEN